jgi:hypothetical protein
MLVLIVGFCSSLWLPALRIQQIVASGPDSDAVQTLARSLLTGTTYGIIPRNSIVFFSVAQVRARILAQYPDIAAAVISRTSLHSIGIASIPRATSFLWCGETYTPLSPTPSPVLAPTFDTTSSCYNTDGEGVIFAEHTAADPVAGDVLKVYGATAANSSDAAVLGAHVSHAQQIPVSLAFVKLIRSLGVSVTTLVMRGDEADLYTQNGTRITYVLGREDAAAQLAQSAFPSLTLNDGTYEYVDLRFDGKVYFKKYGALATDSTAASVPASSTTSVPASSTASTTRSTTRH